MVLTNTGTAPGHRALARVALLVAMVTLAPAAHAQVAASATPDTAAAPGPPAAGTLPLPFRGGPLTTGFNIWYASALDVRTASHNETFEGGRFSMIGIQFSRALATHRGFRYTWLVEVLPAMMATVSAPPSQRPTESRNADAFHDPVRLARYMKHEAYGVGFAPLGVEVARPLGTYFATYLNATAGGAFFSHVVPYGKATQANFTAATSLALEWRPAATFGISGGYTLHHLSNASMGDANPGMNSHMLFVRVGKSRF